MELAAKLQRIRLLIADVDGTLTDGKLYYLHPGEVLRCFHVHDGLGLRLVQQAGISVALISQDSSAAISMRAQKLGIRYCLMGVDDKASTVRQVAEMLSLKLEDVAYIGDDLTDLPAFQVVGVSSCPADAVPEVRRQASYVCRQPGGNGAVREFCELILKAQCWTLERLLASKSYQSLHQPWVSAEMDTSKDS
ncbi:MAG: HAD hydrolase family protein [Chlorobiota bacterium]